MRGKAYDRKQLGNSAGITPACAGKSLCGRCTRRGSRDHPRVCGEKVIAVGKKKSGWGSPPRVRGKVDDAETGDLVHRITPACAGKRVTPSLFLVLHRDHPRVCGEKEARGWPKEQVWGSPPRVRGKVLIRPETRFGFRITPACAGKSSRICIITRIAWDHPRVCGEKTKKIP